MYVEIWRQNSRETSHQISGADFSPMFRHWLPNLKNQNTGTQTLAHKVDQLGAVPILIRISHSFATALIHRLSVQFAYPATHPTF